MADYMRIRLVPLYNVPRYTFNRMRLYQAIEETARPLNPEHVKRGVGLARVGMPFTKAPGPLPVVRHSR